MFEHLSDYQTIFVTGPQRSGTRLTANAIVHDTGHHYVDEAEIATDSVYQVLWVRHTHDSPLVMHCPALCYLLPHLIVSLPSAFLVMCLRNEDEILSSQARIGWNYEWVERLHYPGFPDDWPICRRKYHQWRVSREKISGQYQEVWYHTLQAHPLWVPQDERGPDWGFSQTEKHACF